MADLKSINGLASANIKSINGIAIASVKSYNGLLIPASGWDISGASYDNKSKSVGAQVSPQGFYIKPDGTKIYIAGGTAVYQYSLSTAWDISSATYESIALNIGIATTGVFFKSDGTKIYIQTIDGGNNNLKQYSLTTAWSLSSVTFEYNKAISSQDGSPRNIYFKDDGTKMYIVGTGNSKVYQYSLSTAWNVSTASYDSKSFSVSSQESYPYGLFFKSDGTKMYIVGAGNDTVYQYSLSTSWDVSTASYDSKSFSVSSQDNQPLEVFMKTDGTKMYIAGTKNNYIYQYSL